jgi:ketosteroid isomerase-like protein
MTKTVVLVCLAALLAACPASQKRPVGPPPAPPTPAEVTSAVSARVEQYRQAWEVRSIDALEPLYAHDPALTVTAQGRTQKGWSAVHDATAAFLADCQSYKARFTEVTVTALGDGGALATMTLHRSYGDGVKTVDETGTLMLVFRRQGSEWLIIAEHFSYATVGP